MKITVRYALTGLILFLLSLAPLAANAIDTASGENISVPASKTIEDDFAAGGNTIDIAGCIKGNLYAGGGTIGVTGPITGALHAAGSELTLNSAVGDDLWAAGGTINVHSTVAHNLGLAGGTVTLAPTATVGRDALIAGNQIIVDSSVGHNLNIYATHAVVSGHVAGNIEAYADRLMLTRTAIVDHDVTVYGPNPPEIAPGAQVKGSVHYHPTPEARQLTPVEKFKGWMAGWLSKCASVLVLGFVLLYFVPTQLVSVTEILRRQTGQAFLIGSLAMIAAPLGTLLITVTLIGIPLAVCIGALYVVSLLVAVVPCAYLAGTVLAQRYPKMNRWTSLSLGALCITFITSLPFISNIAEGIVLVLGSGALFLFSRDLILESKKR
jgi:cytoskeletal protein CcmA (bactofilin family)